jgi:DNA-binding CsgD family transcriptional regulator/tetratricopeptide (TPR) repeat protein
MSRDEVADALRHAGAFEPRLVDPVSDLTEGDEGAVASLATALQSGSVRDAFPWRVPPFATPSAVTAIRELASSDRVVFSLVAAAQLLPVALRRDALGRALSKAHLPVPVSLTMSSPAFEVWHREPEFISALAALAEATPEGDERVRLLSRRLAALHALDEVRADELADVARRRRAAGDHLGAAREFDVAAAIAPPAKRGALLVEAAAALGEAQLIRAALVALDEAEPLLADPVLRAQSLFQRGKARVLIEDPLGGAAMQVRAAEAFSRTDPERAAGAFLNASSSLLMSSETHRAMNLVSRARGLSGANAELGIACDVLEGRILLAQGDVAAAEPLLSVADMLARHVLADLATPTLPVVVEHLLWTYLGSLSARDMYDDLATTSETVVALAERFGRKEMGVYARGTMATAAWERGEYTVAQQWLRGTEDAERGGATSWITLVRLLLLGSTGGDVEAAIDRSSINDFEGPTMWTSLRALALALEAFGTRRFADVCSLLDPVLESLVRGGCRSFGGRAWMALLVEAQIRSGLLPAARETAAHQMSWAHLSGFSSLVVPATRVAAMLAAPDEAAACWEEAVEAHERWGHRIELAHTLRARAEWHLGRGLADDSASPANDLERAVHLFRQAGANAMAAWCRELQNGQLLPDRRRPVTPTIEVTSREREIVDLLRVGLSVKTVEAHLRNLFRRNDVRNRAELVGRLRG